MILQELLRNIILYKGLVNPILQVVKENMYALWKPSYSSEFLFKTSGKVKNEVELRFIDCFNISGTQTIPMKTYYENNELQLRDLKYPVFTAVNSRIDLLVLSNVNVIKYAVESIKTRLAAQVLCLKYPKGDSQEQSGSTTGFTIEKYNLYFSHETHEKREYLGEFSLTHEEIQLNSMKERG